MPQLLKSVVILLCISLLAGCFKDSRYLKFVKGNALGTYYTIHYRGDVREDQLAPVLDRVFEQTNQELSNWDSESWVSKFNRSTSTDWIDVPPHAFTVIKFSLELAHHTGGYFDPTLGELLKLWGFGETGEISSPPEPHQISEILMQSGYKKLILDTENKRIRKLSPGLQINLSASAKGYIVDQIHLELQSLGIEHSLINIGGEVRAQGTKSDEQPWRISTDDKKHSFSLMDQAAATSGTNQRFFKHEGITYSHLIDPLSGYPIKAKYNSITTISTSCMIADGLATAFLTTPERKWREISSVFEGAIQYLETPLESEER